MFERDARDAIHIDDVLPIPMPGKSPGLGAVLLQSCRMYGVDLRPSSSHFQAKFSEEGCMAKS